MMIVEDWTLVALEDHGGMGLALPSSMDKTHIKSF